MCHNELTMMMYIDGELDERQRRAVDLHLGECGRCAALVAALRVETRILSETLREAGDAVGAEAEAPPRPVYAPSPRLRAAVAAAIGTVSAGILRVLLESGSLLVSPLLPDWLNPFHSEGLANLSFNAAVYIVQEGEAIMSSMVTMAEFLAVGLLALSALSTTRRVRARGAVVSLMALGVLILAAPVDAMEVRRGQGSVTIPAGQTVDDTLVAFGDTVQIDGIVTGDVIAMGRRVQVRGTVMGNLIALARDVEVDGSVEGSIVQFGQTVTTRGNTKGNLYAFGQTIAVPRGGGVGGNATVFSETAIIEGSVGRDVTSFGRALDVSGTVSRRVTAYGERVDVRTGARIDGSLTAHVRRRENVRVDPGAMVGGGTNIEVEEPAPSRYLTVGYYVRQCLRLAAAFVTGWILFWLVPRATTIRLDTGGAVLTAAGVGVVAVCATPVLALVAGVTIIGLPLAVFAVLLWIVLLYLAKVLLALCLGRMVLGSTQPAGAGIAASLLVGLTLVLVAVNLPYVGYLLNIFLTITGFGAAIIEMAGWYKGSAAVPTGA
jgi:anti-sigma factor RsiW/cytoskeletal protein CcmA (bactofilin family)